MKLACVILLLGMLLTSGPAIAQERSGRVVQVDIPAPSLHGNMFAIPDQQSIAVYLPPSYDAGRTRYPVVIFLTGFGDAVTYFTQYGIYQGFRLGDALDTLIKSGRIGEMIVVIPNTLTFMGGMFCVDSPVTGNWEEYVTRDVVGYVDANYRTAATAGKRGISGHSAGGFSALNLAMRHPDVFSSVYALSPGLFDTEGLSETFMFAEPEAIRAYLATQKTWEGFPEEQARLTFVSYVTQRFFASTDFVTGFTHAYGAAFAPDPTGPVPHIAYPYAARGDSLVRDAAAWRRFENGFGGLDEKVRTYRENLARLRGIGIDVGTADEYVWLPRGCAYLSRLLDDAGIRHELTTFPGTHDGALRQRIEEHMLPFFWRVFSATEGSR